VSDTEVKVRLTRPQARAAQRCIGEAKLPPDEQPYRDSLCQVLVAIDMALETKKTNGK